MSPVAFGVGQNKAAQVGVFCAHAQGGIVTEDMVQRAVPTEDMVQRAVPSV